MESDAPQLSTSSSPGDCTSYKMLLLSHFQPFHFRVPITFLLPFSPTLNRAWQILLVYTTNVDCHTPTDTGAFKVKLFYEKFSRLVKPKLLGVHFCAQLIWSGLEMRRLCAVEIGEDFVSKVVLLGDCGSFRFLEQRWQLFSSSHLLFGSIFLSLGEGLTNLYLWRSQERKKMTNLFRNRLIIICAPFTSR